MKGKHSVNLFGVLKYKVNVYRLKFGVHGVCEVKNFVN